MIYIGGSMKRAIGFLCVILSFSIIVLTQCAPVDDGFGTSTTTTSTSTTTTTTVIESVTFSFEPAFLGMHGAGIENVYLCGSFNNWVTNATPMVYNTTNGKYEFTTNLSSGTYYYKFRVQFDSSFNFYSWNETNCSSIWFADPCAASYRADTSVSSVNSEITIPYTAPSIYTFSGNLENAEDCEIMFYMNESPCWDNFQMIEGIASTSFSVETTLKDAIEIDVHDNYHETNTQSDNYFFSYRYDETGISGNKTVPSIDLSFDNMASIPNNGAIVTNGNITFTWSDPTNIGGLTTKLLRVYNTEDDSDMLNATVTSESSYTISNTSTLDGNSTYYWYVVYITTSGWVLVTHMPVFTIINP